MRAKTSYTKNKISQLFVMRIAIAKSRYENPVGFFRGAQAINPSAHLSPDKIPDSLFRPTQWNPPNGHGQNGHGPIVRLSDGRAEIHLSRSSHEGLQEEYFQHP